MDGGKGETLDTCLSGPVQGPNRSGAGRFLVIFTKRLVMTTFITDRIAINPSICNGRPIVRGMRITVQTVLEFLFAGTPREELLHQYPMLESEDIDACGLPLN
jgi:uncharacterized protein (DUF433 family)